MEQEIKKDPEELYQEELKEEQELLGYCKKIQQGIENLEENSGERAIWELTQNARDMAEHDDCKIIIELKDDKFIFAHCGMPFEFKSLLALVNQSSSKDNPNADLAGQYGTGFMTTHAFSNIVSLDAPYKVMVAKDVLKGYVLLEEFRLDRSFVAKAKNDMTEAKKEMKKEIEAVNKSYKRTPIYSSLDLMDEEKRWTKFTYCLHGRVQEASDQLARAIRLMPLVLLINKRIKEVEIVDDYAHIHQKMIKDANASSVSLEDAEGWLLNTYHIMVKNLMDQRLEAKEINCMESKNGDDKILLPPYPATCGCVDNIPSLFLWFPLLGTEQFGVNFIFHSKRFYPVEKRNNILLPVNVLSKIEKGKWNEAVLKDMMKILLVYYSDETHAATLDINMCQVDFNQNAEDEVTRQFYIDLQDLWKAAIQNWKVIPTVEGKKAITEARVKVLHPDFYLKLSDDERKDYEPMLKVYASKVMYDENNSFLLPSEDLIRWSETVYKWDCRREDDFFISVEDVCKTIKENADDLIKFLQFLKVSGNLSLINQHPLVPNREGELKKKGDLRHGDFMTDKVYELVKVVMGDDAGRMINCDCLRIIEDIPEYTPKHLHDAITSTMQRWRSLYLNPNTTVVFKDEQLSALIEFCSATSQTEFTNIRGRLMKYIPTLFNKEFEQRHQEKLEDKEDEFYSAAFSFMRDYALMTLSLKDSNWVMQNMVWTTGFLKEYATIKDKEYVEKLDTYGVIPNWHLELCLKKELYKNEGITDDLVIYYNTIYNKDLLENWIVEELDSYFDLPAQTPREIAGKIQEELEKDMSDKGEKRFAKILRNVILKLGEDDKWKEWFTHIDDKKATYTFNMKSGDAQKSLFALMDLKDSELQELANLSVDGKMEELIEKMKSQLKQEQEETARFNHFYTIGTHVENALLNAIDSNLIKVEYIKEKEEYVKAANRQNGQDIVVSVKKDGDFIDVFYIEVKSKWSFDDPAHMSSNQVRKACQYPNQYCLCCVDLRQHKDEDLSNLDQQVILDCTKVKLDIGNTLKPLMKEIIEADNRSDDIQIKISDYRSNMGAKVFEQGEPFQKLIDAIIETAQRYLS